MYEAKQTNTRFRFIGKVYFPQKRSFYFVVVLLFPNKYKGLQNEHEDMHKVSIRCLFRADSVLFEYEVLWNDHVRVKGYHE